MKNKENTMKRKKHTPTNDIGYGTKKEALQDIGMDNSDFDTLNTLYSDEVSSDELDEGMWDRIYDDERYND